MKKPFPILVFILMVSFYFSSCGGGAESKSPVTDTSSVSKSGDTDAEEYDPKRGEGEFSADNVKISDQLDKTLATAGESNFGVKCSSCHKLTEEKLVGPGWKGVTSRRTPYWIMNFITNPDPMINKDPAVQAQLELCLVRMPNQNLNADEARQILEFMRKNDGIK
jgi:mono/diheme cytochrome c family protein